MARPQKTLELPDWFSLSKYKELNTLSTAEWFEQFLVRQLCIILLKVDSLPPQTSKDLKLALKLIRDNPIVDTYSKPLLKRIFSDPKLSEIKQNRPNLCRGIRSLTVQDIYKMEADIEKDKRTHAKKYYDENQKYAGKGFYKPKHKWMSWFLDPVSSVLANPNSNDAVICLDLSLSDKALIKLFKNRLSQIRQDAGGFSEKGKSRRSIGIDDFSKFAVLPYLDLYILALEGKKEITKRIMADAIYLAGDRGEDNVKTTKKLAMMFISPKFLDALAAYAADEILIKNKA